MQRILQIANKTKDQASLPGSFVLKRFSTTVFLLCSLLLFGSCNENMSVFGLLNPDRNFEAMAQHEKMRHGQKLSHLLMMQPESLAKLSKEEVAFIFPQPALQIEEGAVKVWQFRTQDCALDLYWKEASADKALQTPAHWNLRQRGALYASHEAGGQMKKSHDWQCLQILLQRQDQSI